MVKDKILLIGASGRGKTYSFRNLNRETTAFINVENKPLPFKTPFKNTAVPVKFSDVLQFIEYLNTRKDIDCVVIDSFSAYIDMLMAEARATKVGWDIMNLYNENIGKFNNAVKNSNKDMFITAHWEVITSELGGTKELRAKVKGKEWEGFIEKDYTITLYAEAKVAFGEQKAKHFFNIYSDGITSAKCPPEIFGETVTTIDNDSNLVLQKIREFRK